MSGGDNRETLAQAMYGKSDDDLEREEQVEMKRLMEGKPATQDEENAEHAAAVRTEDDTDYADRLTRDGLPNDQLASTRRMDAEDVRMEYPSSERSAQGVTKEVVSDEKP